MRKRPLPQSSRTLPWPPGTTAPAVTGGDGIDGWDQRAAALLDALDGDEPDA